MERGCWIVFIGIGHDIVGNGELLVEDKLAAFCCHLLTHGEFLLVVPPVFVPGNPGIARRLVLDEQPGLRGAVSAYSVLQPIYQCMYSVTQCRGVNREIDLFRVDILRGHAIVGRVYPVFYRCHLVVDRFVAEFFAKEHPCLGHTVSTHHILHSIVQRVKSKTKSGGIHRKIYLIAIRLNSFYTI